MMAAKKALMDDETHDGLHLLAPIHVDRFVNASNATAREILNASVDRNRPLFYDWLYKRDKILGRLPFSGKY
jgi:hypothetical protein